jgi:hypothetical protein
MRPRPAGENQIPASSPVAQPNWATRIFLGPHGLRGGWRVLIFMALLVGIVLGCIQVVRAIMSRTFEQAVRLKSNFFSEWGCKHPPVIGFTYLLLILLLFPR